MENNKTNNVILLIPSFILVFSITVYVIINTFKESLGIIPELFLNEITFKYYIDLFTNKVFINGFLYSVFVALISATLSAILGTYLGHVISSNLTKSNISKSSNTKSYLTNTLFRLPIFLSYVAAAALIYNTFSNKGLIYHLLLFVDIKVDSLNIIFNSNGLAVILLNIFKGIPFIAFTVYPILIKVDSAYKETARNLGCTNIKYVTRILLPLCKRAILSSTLIIFNYNLFAYEGFYFLGPSNPTSIGVLAYNTYLNSDMTYRALGMAINMIMIIVSLILCYVYYRLLKGEGSKI